MANIEKRHIHDGLFARQRGYKDQSRLTQDIIFPRAVPFFFFPPLPTRRGRRLWVPGLQRRFGVSHHDNLMTAWVLGPTRPDGQPCTIRDMSSVFAGPLVSWPCSCPMLLQILLCHATYTPDQGARHGEHGITEPTGLARENLNRVELIISPYGEDTKTVACWFLTTPPDRSEKPQIYVPGLLLSVVGLSPPVSPLPKARHARRMPNLGRRQR